jgi:1,2-diacylglycerol 3-beta-galactosyltransferase
MGPLEEIARTIAASCPGVSLVVIAGRNHSLKERLNQIQWPIPTFIYDFVREMPDFMHAADILVTKAGPGTICEALIAGLPMVLYSRLPGQEEGNVRYTVKEGAGVWAPRPELIASAICNWIEHPEERKRVAAACRRLARPQAARQIARILIDQIERVAEL